MLSTEFNIEGYPNQSFIELVIKAKPAQVTLVPDPPHVLTSNAGWNTVEHKNMLCDIIKEFHANSIRTSIFIETDAKMIENAKKTGTDRIELYTESYASNFLKNKVLKIYNKPDKIQVVTPGINFSEFKLPEPKEMLRKKYNVDSNTKVIVSSGHLIKNKAFDRGVRAVARLIKNGHNVHYFILGEGIEKDNLVALAQELNIRDKVTIHVIKDRQKYAEYLKIADLYLGTSINEGFGIVFLEARASSLPIVAIDVGGVAEAAGETAILIKEDKLDDLVKKIEIGFSSQISNIDVSFDWNDKLAKFKKVLYNS